MVNKYAEELRKEQEIISKSNPFLKQETQQVVVQRQPEVEQKKLSVPYIEKKEKSENYFNLILASDYQDLEMEIRGLSQYREIDSRGKEIIVTRRRKEHYLSEQGAEDLLQELKAYLNSDIKLGVMTRDEFLMQVDIIRKFFHSYLSNNLYKLGMDTELKQRKAPTLFTMIMARIRAVYSRSVAGLENQRSHGDIKLSGDLDIQREERFKMEDVKN